MYQLRTPVSADRCPESEVAAAAANGFGSSISSFGRKCQTAALCGGSIKPRGPTLRRKRALGELFRSVITEWLPRSSLEGGPVTKPVCEPRLVDLACCHRKHRFNGVVDVGLLVVP